MVTRVEINDRNKCAVRYISELPGFRNKRVWKFKPGVNIIVGENGSGKSTLMKIIEYYLLVGKRECEIGMYNCNVTRLQGTGFHILDGVGVYADYNKNTFRLCHKQDKDNVTLWVM